MSAWVKRRDVALLVGGMLSGWWLYGQLVEWLQQRAMVAEYDRQITQPQAHPATVHRYQLGGVTPPTVRRLIAEANDYMRRTYGRRGAR